MPITKSAKKALRNSTRKRGFNLARRGAMKNAVKELKKMLATGEVKDALVKLALAYQAIDKAVKRGVIKSNTAARQKSRLARLAATKKG